MRSLTKIIFLATLLSALSAYAGSVFSASPSGIGLRRYSVSARGMGMGKTGLASPDSLTLTNYAISKWRTIDQTRITISIRYERFDTEISDVRFTTRTGAIGDLLMAIPLKEHKFLIGLSLTPYSITDFRYILTVNTASLNYSENIFHEGNITRAQAALIWAPLPGLGLSANVNYYFGTLKDRYQLQFNDVNYFDSSHEIEYRIAGPGMGFSMDLSPARKLNFAGFIDLKPSIRLDRQFSSPISQKDEVLTNAASFPVHYGIGVSYRVLRRLLVTADYSRQNWSEGIGLTLANGGVSNSITGKSNLDDWYLFGIGIERNARRGRGVKFWNGVDLRAGFSTAGLGYKFNGNPVIQYAGHLGLGIPFSKINRFDIGFAAGVRGNIRDNGTKETFIKFEFSISLGEHWFQKIR